LFGTSFAPSLTVDQKIWLRSIFSLLLETSRLVEEVEQGTDFTAPSSII
jgi:hypothetical protein